jgi:hypothetical protein
MQCGGNRGGRDVIIGDKAGNVLAAGNRAGTTETQRLGLVGIRDLIHVIGA